MKKCPIFEGQSTRTSVGERFCEAFFVRDGLLSTILDL